MRPLPRYSATILIALLVQPFANAANLSDFIDYSMASGGQIVLPGRLYVPPATTDSVLHPFILYLHGGGEDGSDNVRQIDGNIDGLLAEAKQHSAFLYAPQTTWDWSSSALTDLVMTMIDRALSQRAVDADRLYITGISLGGAGTWNMLSRYGNRFSAAVPICGERTAPDFVASHLIDTPVWAFHARDDSVVPVTTTRSTINSILMAGQETPPTYPIATDPSPFFYKSPSLDLRYIELATGGHGIGPTVYSYGEVFDWLFAHTLAAGDYNLDGRVNQDDYTAWKSAFGSANSQVDGNGDRIVDAADYVIWRQHLGQSTGSGSATAVAEPSCLMLFGIAAVISFNGRRHAGF